MNIKHKTLQFKKKKISGYCCKKKKKVPEIKEKKRTAKTNRAERISKNEAWNDNAATLIRKRLNITLTEKNSKMRKYISKNHSNKIQIFSLKPKTPKPWTSKSKSSKTNKKIV